MIELTTLLTFSTFTLASLVVGYLGYWIASVGDIPKLLPMDRAFQILTFALVYQGAFAAIREVTDQILAHYVGAALLAILLAVGWRRFLRLRVMKSSEVRKIMDQRTDAAECAGNSTCLSIFSTRDLNDELLTREGVVANWIGPEDELKTVVKGPAWVLVNRD